MTQNVWYNEIKAVAGQFRTEPNEAFLSCTDVSVRVAVPFMVLGNCYQPPVIGTSVQEGDAFCVFRERVQ